MGAERYILHADMDQFFAAVEQLDQPELRGKPILVGGLPHERGVVSTASYEARRFGCHSAMPMAQAIRLCPHAIVVPVRMERYVEVSRHIFEILAQFTPLVEPLSIDEAFLDVTGSIRLLGSAEAIGREVKHCIKTETQLTASVGVAPNLFLAKLASDLEKPDGLTLVKPDHVQAFLDPLSISRLWGAGKATQAQFEAMGVHTFAEARQLSESQLRKHFGKSGTQFYQLVRGIDDRCVTPDHEAKSISHEITFPVDILDRDCLRRVLLDQTDQVARRLRRQHLLARTVTLKIRYHDFTTITRRTTLPSATDQTDVLWETAAQLFEAWCRQASMAVRLLGMGVTQLTQTGGEQLTLFDQDRSTRTRQLDKTLDAIRDRFGRYAVNRGASLRDPKKSEER